VLDILPQIGISSGTGILLFFVMQKMLDSKANEIEKKNAKITELQNEATRHRKEERDNQMLHLKEEIETKSNAQNQKIDVLEVSMRDHIASHDELGKNLEGKIEKVEERLYDINEALSEIKGYMRGKDDKSV